MDYFKSLILVCLFITTPVFGETCEVPKNEIDINGLSLGRSILLIAKEHPKTFDIDYNDSKAFINFVDQHDFKDRFHGTPASGAGYISFNNKTARVNGFSIRFDTLNSLSAEKYKNTLINLYSLPKNNWKASVSVDGYKEFLYKCKDYTIEINYSQERNSFMVIEEK